MFLIIYLCLDVAYFLSHSHGGAAGNFPCREPHRSRILPGYKPTNGVGTAAARRDQSHPQSLSSLADCVELARGWEVGGDGKIVLMK